MINNKAPSRIASYNCEGWRGKESTVGKITDQTTEVCLPYSSALIKFAILPKNIPIGATQAIISNKNRAFIFFNGLPNVLYK